MSDEPGSRTSGPDIPAIRLDVNDAVDKRVYSRRGGSGDGDTGMLVVQERQQADHGEIPRMHSPWMGGPCASGGASQARGASHARPPRP